MIFQRSRLVYKHNRKIGFLLVLRANLLQMGTIYQNIQDVKSNVLVLPLKTRNFFLEGGGDITKGHSHKTIEISYSFPHFVFGRRWEYLSHL